LTCVRTSIVINRGFGVPYPHNVAVCYVLSSLGWTYTARISFSDLKNETILQSEGSLTCKIGAIMSRFPTKASSPSRASTCSLLKIKMMMPPASRIKSRPAPRTPRLAIHILPNRHLHPASPTQNRPRIPLPLRPNRNRMPRQRNMAILASPVDPAAPHLDRNNVQRRPVVHAPSLRINTGSAHVRFPAVALQCHRLEVIADPANSPANLSR
jgi:hypothetical protein